MYEAADFIAQDIVDRQRLVLRLFQEVIKPNLCPEAVVVDGGCGAGQTASLIRSQGFRVIGLDSVPEMLRQARTNLSEDIGPPYLLVQADVEAMGLADGRVDCLILMGVVEYLLDSDACWREAVRALKPGGFVIVTAPNPNRLMAALHGVAKKWLPRSLVKRLKTDEKGGMEQSFVHTPYTQEELRRLGGAHGLTPLAGVGHGFGPLTWRNRPIFSVARSVALSKWLFMASRRWPFRWLAKYSNNYILCARKPFSVDRAGANATSNMAFAHGVQHGSRQRLKRAVKQTLVASGALAGLNALAARKNTEPLCWILAFHSVGGTAYYQDGACSIPEARDFFARQVEFLMTRYTISNFRDVLEAWEGGRSLKEPTVVLTFDDGLMDQYTVAWPVLKALGAPATFYICPDYVERPENIYVERIAGVVYASPSRELILDEPTPGQWDLQNFRGRRKAVWDLIEIVKPLTKDERDEVIRTVAKNLSVDPALLPYRDLTMQWPHVDELAQAGMEIGSHSLTHPLLPALSRAALQEELEGSRRILEEQVGCRPETFCYPYGGSRDISHEVALATKEAGYRAAVTVIPGWTGRRTARFALPRVSVQLPWVQRDLRCALSPGLHAAAQLVPRLQGFIYG